MRLQEWTPEEFRERWSAEDLELHNADVRSANAEMGRLERERDEARAEVERLNAHVSELEELDEGRKYELDRRARRIAELEAQLAEARKATPLPESVEALKWRTKLDGYSFVQFGRDDREAPDIYGTNNGSYARSDAHAESFVRQGNLALEAACAIGLAKGQDAEEKLAKVREVARQWASLGLHAYQAMQSIAAIVEPPHVHEYGMNVGVIAGGYERICSCGARQVAEWKDAPK